MAKFSIILPVRNGGSYVKECVNSILSQTHADFNFIILDNCSTDGTYEWLGAIADKRINIIRSETALTIEENWGRIKDVEKNEFITLIGHDDILYPDFLQTINEMIKTHPGAGLYHTHFNFINASGRTIRTAKPMREVYTGSEFLEAFLSHTIESMGTGYAMRSKDYDRLGGIPVKYPNLLFADFELWVSLVGKGFIAISPKNCFAFRVHHGTTSSSADKILHRALQIFIDFLAGLKPADENMGNAIHRQGATFLLNCCKSYAHRLLRSPLKNREGVTVAKFIQQTKLWAEKLGVADSYLPEKNASLKLAAFIDRSSLLRRLFLFVKKIYPKPIL